MVATGLLTRAPSVIIPAMPNPPLHPLQIDGVTLSDTTDFAALLSDILRGGGGAGALRSDMMPLDWVARVYPTLLGGPYADRFSDGVAACLTAPEPFVRHQALLFFEQFPHAHGGDRIEELVDGDRALFAGVREPPTSDTDLEWSLLRALGARAGEGLGRALEQARRAALAAGKAQAVMAALASADPDWVVAHADAIVRGSPDAYAPMLRQIQRAGGDVAGLGARIAALGVVEPNEFRYWVGRIVRDPAARDHILAALPAPN